MVDSSSDEALSAVLSLVRLRGTVFGTGDLGAPWGVRSKGLPNIACYVLLGGSAVLTERRRSRMHVYELRRGDVALVRSGVAHELKDSLAARAVPFEQLRRGAPGSGGTPGQTWGGDGARTSIVCGAMELDDKERPLFEAALPPCVHIRSKEVGRGAQAIVDALAAELDAPALGTPIVLTRLAELLFVHVLRVCAQRDRATVGWLRGLGHPSLAKALAAIHGQPGHSWTLAKLAAKASMSRSTFAQTFKQEVGTSPLVYLTEWRMRQAARLLEDPERSLKSIALDVGYASDEAFSRAFRGWAQMPPGAYRRVHHVR